MLSIGWLELLFVASSGMLCRPKFIAVLKAMVVGDSGRSTTGK